MGNSVHLVGSSGLIFGLRMARISINIGQHEHVLSHLLKHSLRGEGGVVSSGVPL